MVRKGKEFFKQDEETIQRFLRGKLAAWHREGIPFHLWLTSPVGEVVDITFAMNCGWAKNRQECDQLLVYQTAHTSRGDHVFHPTLVGPYFFHQSGAVF